MHWEGGKQLEIFKDTKCKKYKESWVQVTESSIKTHNTIEVEFLQ